MLRIFIFHNCNVSFQGLRIRNFPSITSFHTSESSDLICHRMCLLIWFATVDYLRLPPAPDTLNVHSFKLFVKSVEKITLELVEVFPFTGEICSLFFSDRFMMGNENHFSMVDCGLSNAATKG